MSKRKSIKELKAELDANQKQLRQLNKAKQLQQKAHHDTLNKTYHQNVLETKLKKNNRKIKKAERKIPRKGILERLHIKPKNRNRKRKHKTSKVLSLIIFPAVLVFSSITLLAIFTVNATQNYATSTIAGLIDPKQRAIMKAEKVLTDSSVTNIPHQLVGALSQFGAVGSGGSANGFGQSSSGNGSKGNKGNKSSFNNISGNIKSELGRVKMVASWLEKNTKLTKAEIAGIIGNFSHESSVNPMMIQGGTGESNSQLEANFKALLKSHNPGASGVGLGQWTNSAGSPRASKMLEAAGWNFNKASTINFQMRYWYNEDPRWHSNGSVWGAGGHDVNAATEAYMNGWERPKAETADLKDRQAFARKVYSII